MLLRIPVGNFKAHWYFFNDTANKYCELTFLLTLPTENDIQIICTQLKTGTNYGWNCEQLKINKTYSLIRIIQQNIIVTKNLN